MAAIVYLLGTIVTLVCAVLLLRAWSQVRMRFLLWCGLCFTGLTLSNGLLYLDLVAMQNSVSLYVWRLGTAAVSMAIMVYGLVTESE